MSFFPQVLLYRHSPNDFLRKDLTISIEPQVIDTVDVMMRHMEKTGRISIIIEGDMSKVQPYLTAIEALMVDEGVKS